VASRGSDGGVKKPGIWRGESEDFPGKNEDFGTRPDMGMDQYLYIPFLGG